MDKLQLGFYIRGKWELRHGTEAAAIEAFNVLGNNPHAKTALVEIKASHAESIEALLSIYLDAANEGLIQFLPMACSLMASLDSDDVRLPQLRASIDAQLEANNPLVVRGAFMERMSAGDFSSAAWACSEAIRLRDPQSMSKLAAILINPEGYEEFVYFLSDKEIFNPQPWPVPIAVRIPHSRLFDSEGAIHQDSNAFEEGFTQDMDARKDYENFVDSLLDQGEDGPFFEAGRLSALFEIIQDDFWAVHKMNEFANDPENTKAFWNDPDLILFYTFNLVSTYLHYQVEWLRNGISQYGLEDIFDRTIQLALASETRNKTEQSHSYRRTHPTITLPKGEVSIFKAFQESAIGSTITLEKIEENPYCKLFDEGRLVDLTSLLRSDAMLAAQGAESIFEDLSIFLVLGNTYGEQGFHEYLAPALGVIEEVDNVDENFLDLLAKLWLEVGHKGFDEHSYAVYRLPNMLFKKNNVNQEYRNAISLFFPLTRAVENLHSAVDDLLEELESGQNVVGKLSAALQKLISDETAPLNNDVWWGEELRYSFLDPFEVHDNLWTNDVFDLIDAIASIDERYVCNLIEIDSDRFVPFFQGEDLTKITSNRWCDDDACEGLAEMAARHPNAK